MAQYHCHITPELARTRLDRALTSLLADQLPSLSRARLQALMAEGRVSLNKKPIDDASRKVKSGESYYIEIPPAVAALPEAQAIPLTIIYEDDDVIVIDKPVGLVVHPAPGNRDRTLVNALLAHCGKSLSGIGGVARPGIVHRLDKDTSGLMVVAKNDLAHHALTRQFADRSLSRIYQALVWGRPEPASGMIEAAIGRHARDRKKMAVTAKGKPAITHYKTLRSFGQPPLVSLVECKLATGRTHQIRVHLASLHHPVVGDPVYGKRMSRQDKPHAALAAFPRQALHAVNLQFIHPRTGKLVRFTSALPEDMQELLQNLTKIKN